VPSVVVFILVVVWGVYLGMWLRSRRDRRSMSSISTFNKHLAVLGQTAPGSPRYGPAPARSGLPAAPAAPPIAYAPLKPVMTLADARNRRRQVLTTLTAVASVTAAMAVIGGGSMVVLHLLADVLLVTYVVLLARTQRVAAERRHKVVYLNRGGHPATLAAMGDTAYLRRSAN
jgi:hypothetical protein